MTKEETLKAAEMLEYQALEFIKAGLPNMAIRALREAKKLRKKAAKM